MGMLEYFKVCANIIASYCFSWLQSSGNAYRID